MGHVVFIPYSGGGASSGAQFISDLYTDDSNYSAYVDLSTGPEVFFTPSFSMWFAFRLAQRINVSTKLFEIVDSAGQGFSIAYNNGTQEIDFALGVNTLSTLNNDMPIGRVILLGFSTTGGDAQAYVQGRQVATGSIVPFDPATNPSGVVLGGSTSWANDLVEILGWSWMNNSVDTVAHGDVFMALLNNERMVLPSSVTPYGDWVTYAVDTGLTDVNTWVPETGSTLTSLQIPLVTVGTNTPVVITSPLHLAHSGWSDINPV